MGCHTGLLRGDFWCTSKFEVNHLKVPPMDASNCCSTCLLRAMKTPGRLYFRFWVTQTILCGKTGSLKLPLFRGLWSENIDGEEPSRKRQGSAEERPEESQRDPLLHQGPLPRHPWTCAIDSRTESMAGSRASRVPWVDASPSPWLTQFIDGISCSENLQEKKTLDVTQSTWERGLERRASSEFRLSVAQSGPAFPLLHRKSSSQTTMTHKQARSVHSNIYI